MLRRNKEKCCTSTKTGDNGNATFPSKVRILKIPAKRFLYRSLWAKILEKKVSNFSKTPKKIIPGPILGQDRPENNSAKMFVRSVEILSPGQTSIDKTNDCAMNSERGALVRGSNPPYGHSVHITACDTWRAPARRLIQTHLSTCVENRRQKISICLRW